MKSSVAKQVTVEFETRIPLPQCSPQLSCHNDDKIPSVQLSPRGKKKLRHNSPNSLLCFLLFATIFDPMGRNIFVDALVKICFISKVSS